MNRNVLIVASVIALIAGYLALTKRGQEILQEGQDIVMALADKISDYGLSLIKNFEGFSATPYRDAAGWSIGYGHYMGVAPTMQYVSPDMAEELLTRDTETAQSAVRSLVTVPLNQNQFDSLTSLVYNIGVGAFGKSTLLRLLNDSNYQGAADQFPRWNKSEGKINPVLVARSEHEREIFLA